MQSKFRFLTMVLAIIMIVAMAGTSFAVKANPRPRTLTQPDGGKISAVLMGDEHFHFAEDADGYSIIQNKDGWWTYAGQENGLLVATDLVVGKSICPFAQHLRPNSEAVAALAHNSNRVINWTSDMRHKMSTDFLYGPGQTKESSSKLAGGRHYMNVVMGDFSDSTFAWYAATEKAGNNPYTPFPYDHSAANNHALATTNWFNFLIHGDSISPYVPDSSIVGSLSNYYFDLSYRREWFVGGVSPLIATGVARTSAVQSDAPSSAYYTAALSGADPFIDYDQDNDLVADNLILVHPGPGQEESSDTKDIWSMSMGVSVGTSDGVTIRALIACPQNSQLGVFAHEMFHQVGGPDLYDYGYSGTPWGEWSLMDNGSYNGSLGGDQPAFPGGHLAYDLDGKLTNGIDGWLTAGAVGNSDSISSLYRGDGQYTICALDSAGEARRGNPTNGIRLWRIRNNAFRDSGQVFFVELRSRTPPYESGTTESGLIITHIDTRMGLQTRFNDGPPCEKYYYSWVEQPGNDPNINYAAGDSNFPRNPSNACYSANDFSAGGYTENAIDSLSIPNCKTNKGAGNGNGNGPWIYDVSAEGPIMTFKVARTGLLPGTPLVGYTSVVVKDPVVVNTANNNNGMLDPWETDTLRVTFRNTGTAITVGARCSLYVVSGVQYVESLTGGTQTVGSGVMASNSEAQSGPFVVKIKKDTPKFTDIVFGAVFTSTTPNYSTTSNFGLRVSGLKVVMAYDFINIRAGGTTWSYRIQPSSVAVLGDTIFLTNANLDNAAFQTRIYALKKNTTNNPLVGGPGGDTIRSLNNKGTVHVATVYGGGIDIDNSKNLWYSLADSIYQSNRATTIVSKFRAPNVDWGGTPMLRIRGVAFGPTVVDTFGPNLWPGDSLWAYWQNYDMYSESLMVYSKPASGTAVKRAGYSWDDDLASLNLLNDKGEWWNGRALEYDGSSIWTSSVWQNVMIRRNAYDAKTIEIMPGPSSYGSYGTYGMAIEVTNAAGVPYAPTGTVTFVPGTAGTRYYLYCASMDEGKIYKVDITDFVLPTPPDSLKAQVVGSDNRIDWWKANDDAQKVAQYIIYRQAPGTTTPPTSGDELVRVKNAYAGPLTHTYTDVGAGTKTDYVYTVKSVSYYGEGTWGASINAPLIGEPEAVELIEFSCVQASGNSVSINWRTASEVDNVAWEVERSADGENFTQVGKINVTGSNPYGDKYTYTDNVPAAGMYYYRLVDVSKSDERTYHGPISVVVGAVYALGQNYPNPIGNSPATIKYSLKKQSQTSLKIYNLLGEEVKTLVNAKQDANFYTVHWDGRDNKGQAVANGVYFYKLNSGEFSATKKMMVLR